MTFLSRRKRRTTLHGSAARRATTIISALLVWLGAAQCATAQPLVPVPDGQVVTPKFVPIGQRPPSPAPARNVMPATFQPDQAGRMRAPIGEDAGDSHLSVRTELPGPQTQFSRESETDFYNRIRQEAKRRPGAGPAIFPEETPVSKITYTTPAYPRVDPISKQPYPVMVETASPIFVCHRRLLFEQPNFERLGWNFGILQPGLQMATFYYDMAMLPYHVSSNFRVRGECNVGKCLPGDPAPFTVPIERFSVTGVIGEAGAIIGGVYLFPHY